MASLSRAKGGLISEGILTLVPLPKNGAKSRPSEIRVPLIIFNKIKLTRFQNLLLAILEPFCSKNGLNKYRWVAKWTLEEQR